MKILIADQLSDHALQALRQLGVELAVRPELSAADLAGAIGGFHVLIVRSTNSVSVALSGSALGSAYACADALPRPLA